MKLESFKILLIRNFPFKQRKVFFKSFYGQYNDNPKYISEKLHELRPDIKIVWVITEKSNEIIPTYVNKVPLGGIKCLIELLTSLVLVDNFIGMVSGKSNYAISIPNNRVLNISTWHGVPLKKIGLEIPGEKKKYYISTSNMIISGNSYAKNIFERAFYPISQMVVGYPRNDILVNKVDDISKAHLRNKLHLPIDKRILLFAPTFRNSLEFSGLNQMMNFDIERLLNIFSEKFGGNWCFVFRVHHKVLDAIDTESISNKYKGMVFDGNIGDDMAEYLAASDALITDYSGSLFDYALTDKPCFLYIPDKDNYINQERGIYMAFEELPYPNAENLENLYAIIKTYDLSYVEKRKKEFLNRIGSKDDGKASEKIANIIIDYLEKGARK